MNTLQTIQTIAKIGRVISKVIFVFCIVGFCLCAVGAVSLALGTPTLKLGGVTLQGILQENADMTTGSLYAALAAGAITCVGEGILAKFASRYFTKELADGTPFTVDGAKELLRLGILSVCIPIGIRIASEIAQKILETALTDVEPLKGIPEVSVGICVMVIILALVCKYGAEKS